MLSVFSCGLSPKVHKSKFKKLLDNHSLRTNGYTKMRFIPWVQLEMVQETKLPVNCSNEAQYKELEPKGQSIH